MESSFDHKGHSSENTAQAHHQHFFHRRPVEPPRRRVCPVIRAGVTFRYTERGSEGLLTGKKAYVFAARGGVHTGTASDTQTAYVRNFLGFVGITDVEFVYAEGLAMGDAAKNAALRSAHSQTARLVGDALPLPA
jgi:hypothetical protein